MNTTFKGILVIIAFLGLTFSLFTYSRNIFGTQLDSYVTGGNIQYYVYTDNLGDGTYRVTLTVNGLRNGQELIVYKITINDRDLFDFDSHSLVNGKETNDVFPLKLNGDNNTVELLLYNVVSGQFINIKLDTNMGVLYITLSI